MDGKARMIPYVRPKRIMHQRQGKTRMQVTKAEKMLLKRPREAKALGRELAFEAPYLWLEGLAVLQRLLGTGVEAMEFLEKFMG